MITRKILSIYLLVLLVLVLLSSLSPAWALLLFVESNNNHHPSRISSRGLGITSRSSTKTRYSMMTILQPTRLKMNYNNNNNNNNNNSYSNPDVLLQLVEELTMAVDEVTPELYEKMEQVELSLAKFLEEKSNSLNYSSINKPPPPTIPPPTKAFYNNNNNNNNDSKNTLSNDLLRAEQALEKLRQRLKKEEEALFQAEQILQRSLEEQDILRRAEEALQKSRQSSRTTTTTTTTTNTTNKTKTNNGTWKFTW